MVTYPYENDTAQISFINVFVILIRIIWVQMSKIIFCTSQALIDVSIFLWRNVSRLLLTNHEYSLHAVWTYNITI
jgi:hypothetical protein